MIAIEEFHDKDEIQEFYDYICKKYNKLRVRVYFVSTDEESLRLTKRKLDYAGLYIEIPFSKIFLNRHKVTTRVIHHEMFHHLNPNLNDGPRFQKLLNEFIALGGFF